MYLHVIKKVLQKKKKNVIKNMMTGDPSLRKCVLLATR